MSKSIFIENFQSGTELINEPFLIQEIARRKTRDGRPYLLGALRDKTGSIGTVFWDFPDYVNSWLQEGQVVLITGYVSTYKDTLQVTITDLNPSETADLQLFLPSSQRETAEMVAKLRQEVALLAEPWQQLVAKLLLVNDGTTQRFANSPAARTMHHAYVGGLIEHTLNMVTLARFLANQYPFIDEDLLVSGVLLHDMGKMDEYSLEGEFAYSNDGRLVGHITRAVIKIEMTAAEIDFPEDKLQQIVHLVASHHGKLEWGSPVVPRTLEAVILHQVDMLDSRVQGYMDHLAADSSDREWTARSSYMFGTELMRPPDYEKPE